MSKFKVGDLVVRKPEYINSCTPWERDCKQRGLDPYAPTRVRDTNAWGIRVDAPNTATWAADYFHHCAPLNKPLEDYM